MYKKKKVLTETCETECLLIINVRVAYNTHSHLLSLLLLLLLLILLLLLTLTKKYHSNKHFSLVDDAEQIIFFSTVLDIRVVPVTSCRSPA